MNIGEKPAGFTAQDVDGSEIHAFYNSLTAELKYFDRNPLKPPGKLVFITGVRVDDKLVGVAGLKRYYCFLHSVFYMVKTEFQGEGFGKQLANGLIAYAKERGYSFLLISVHRENTPSLALWQKVGARITCEAGGRYRLGYYLDWKGRVMCRAVVPVLLHIHFSALKLKRTLSFWNRSKELSR